MRAPGLEPTVLTIEGGGSLGVYEAGMTYVLVETFKQKRANPSMPMLAQFPAFCLKAATGASAGNINAFLAAVSWCDATRDTIPEESPFWETWVTTGLTQLLPTHGDTNHKKEGGIFTRRHFRGYVDSALHGRWKKARTIPGCVVEFGSTVTRLAPDTVPGAGSIKARNQRMAFALRVRGIGITPGRDSAGPEPHLTAFVPDTTNNAYGRLTMLGPAREQVDSARANRSAQSLNRVTWDDALQLIETSSGYPVAFEPLKLEFCREILGQKNLPVSDWTCGKRDSVVVLDGGVFDNGPIALGYLLYFETDPGSGPTPPTAIYLSPDRRRVWPEGPDGVTLAGGATKSKSKPHGLESITQLAPEVISTARQYELAFAGRILPTEIALRHGEGRLSGLLGELERQGRMHSLERDSLQRAITQLCLAYRLAQRDPLAALPSSCGSLVRLDTTISSSPPASSSFSPPPYALSHGSSLRLVASMATIDSTFRSTERWHPLAGDWLAGFGAFLGRPLREYDFYVGMYDAFVLLAENLHCADRLGASKSETPREASYSQDAINRTRLKRDVELRQCLIRTLPAYFERPPIPLGPIAPHILRDLFEAEFRVRPDTLRSPSDPEHRSTLAVIRAVRQAMHDTYMPAGGAQQPGSDRAKPSRGHCTKLGMFEAIYCKPGGMVAFLDQLVRHHQAVAIMKRWSEADECHEKRWQRPDLCRTERRFVQMIEDAEARLSKLVGELLWRLETVTPEKSGARMGASALLFIHSSFVDRHRRGLSVGPTSVPRSVGWRRRYLLNLLPTSVMLTPNIAGWPELTWEARYHLGETRYALTVPVHARVQSEIGKRGPGSPDVSMIVPGIRLENKEFFRGTRVGVEIDAWYVNRGWLPSRYVGHTYGLYTTILSKLDASLTTVPADLTYYQEKAKIRLFGEPLILTVGVGDVSGIVYWLGRFASSRWKGAREGH